MDFLDDYRATGPKVDQHDLNKSVFEHSGRTVGEDGEAFVYYEYDKDRGITRANVLTSDGKERMPLGYNVCCYCARDMETRHGLLADGKRVICPHCHAWHHIP
jgi:hypothetical protein